MPVPLALAAPAWAAGLAYANARTGFWYDRKLFMCAFKSAGRIFFRERRGRLNLFYLLEDRARHPSTANKDLLIFEGNRFSYAQVYERVLRYGAWLKKHLGIKPKDIVAIDFQNSDNFIMLWWGLWSIGAKPAFINYNLTGDPLAHCIKSANTKLCLVDPAVADHVTDHVREKLGGSVQFLVFSPDVEAECLACPPTRAPDEDRHEDGISTLATLIFTSGTTGMPKAAVVSWSRCIVGSTVPEVLLGRGSKDILYTSMPLYHSSASILAFCATVSSGSTLALGRKFSTKVFWQECRAAGATSIQYVGETLRYLLAAPPQMDATTGENLDRKHGVTLAFGNGLRPDIWNEFKDRFGIETIAEFYASTEGPFATWNVSRNDLTAGAIGRNGWLFNAFLRLQVSLVAVDWQTDAPIRNPKTGFCRKVKGGEPGEMLFKLPVHDLERLFQGYYGNQKATVAKVMRDVFAKGDAWYRTGDVARWYGDGRVFFTDRIGDTFRWKSENVSTVEVSQAVGLHPSVREANVYGVELPHHDGRAGCVAICFDQNPPPRDTLRSLASHVREALPRYAVPLFLRIVPEVGGGGQTTGTNKQQKHTLRQAGVQPGKGDADGMFWLKGDTYVPFGENEWKALQRGSVKL
ncbi:long-chain fatty acid transporter [Drechmeria coniospora]|uniref:Very long-chain fatty acid transport protein n=1 Tax=Drechmeria coniospora TaxID=98403 RepID=A0A151GKN0_DRECN|nr:long-chain fatty acid transporter [Drechmeria coniospora]KYK57648.1 long-chain fatty acid transporter [Drechmeria coniospora]